MFQCNNNKFNTKKCLNVPRSDGVKLITLCDKARLAEAERCLHAAVCYWFRFIFFLWYKKKIDKKNFFLLINFFFCRKIDKKIYKRSGVFMLPSAIENIFFSKSWSFFSCGIKRKIIDKKNSAIDSIFFLSRFFLLRERERLINFFYIKRKLIDKKILIIFFSIKRLMIFLWYKMKINWQKNWFHFFSRDR